MSGDAGIDRAFPELAAQDRYHELANRFTFHPAHSGQTSLYESNRAYALALAGHLVAYVPASPELDRAIDAIDSAVMWANAAIARHWER